MKKIFTILILALAILIYNGQIKVQSYEGDTSGDSTVDFGGYSETTHGDGSVTQSCANGTAEMDYPAPPGDFGESGDGGSPPTQNPPVCIPEGQACPQTQDIRVMTSPGKYCSPAQQLHKLCTPKSPTYTTQSTTIDCCSSSCNNGVCGGGGPPPDNPPPPPPSCNQPCKTDQMCEGYNYYAGDGCTKCVLEPTPAQGEGNCPVGQHPSTDGGPGAPAVGTCVANEPKGVCKPPEPPKCDSPCTKDSECTGDAAKFGCNKCVANKCSPPPSAPPTVPPTVPPSVPPTIPPPSCGTPCDKPSDCVGASLNCTICANNKCSAPPTATITPIPPTATATPVPPTPTPTFNPASCICDGINYTNLATNKDVTITSFAKILGSDAARGTITGQKFFLTEGTSDLKGKIIAKSDLIPATPSDSRYQSSWTFKFPVLVSGHTYTIWSQIDCQPKAVAYTSSSIAGTSQTQSFVPKVSLLGKFFTFLSGIFGVKQNYIAKVPATSPAPKVSNSINSEVSSDATPLQLDTISPIEVIEKACHTIKLRYNY